MNKDKFSHHWVIIGVLILAGVFGLLSYYYQSFTVVDSNDQATAALNTSQGNLKVVQSVPPVEESTTSKDDPTITPSKTHKDILVYTSQEFKYSFEYPKAWIFDSALESASDPHLMNIAFVDGDQSPKGQVVIEIQPDSDKPAEVNLFDYITKSDVNGGFGMGEVCPCSKLTLAGLPAVKLTNSGGEGAGPGYAIQNPNDPTKFVHFFVYTNSSKSSSEYQTAVSIINSFKFLK